MPELERAPRHGFEIGKDGTSVLVVGFDGSGPSRDALAYAAGLARREQAHLLITFVQPFTEMLPFPGACAPVPDEADDELRAEVRRELSCTDVQWTCVFVRGDAACELEKLAGENRADAIVVGRSKGWLHNVAGSVSGRLARRATHPVIVVP